MIRYDWKAIRRHTKDDPFKVYKFFRDVRRDIPTSQVERILNASINKDSYLLWLEPLILNRERVSYIDIFVYLHIASKRNYFDYVNSKKYDLHIGLVPEFSKDKIIFNRLLTIEDNLIKLKYEEEYVRNQVRRS